jgi:hypothetical protein
MPLRYNSLLIRILPAARQLGPLPAISLWAVLSLAAGLYGAWLGFGGRAFAATLTAFAFLLLVMLLSASRGVIETLSARLGSAAGILLGATLFLAYLIYVLGTNTFAFSRAGAVLALIFVPLAAAVSAERRPAGAWQDFAIVAAVWVTVKLSRLWLRCHPVGSRVALHAIRAALEFGSFPARCGSRHSDFHRMAGRISLSWLVAEHIIAKNQQRSHRLVRCLRALRSLAHHQWPLPQLGLRPLGHRCGIFLRMDVAQIRLHLRLRHRPRPGGRHLALFLSHHVRTETAVRTPQEKTNSRPHPTALFSRFITELLRA